MKEKSIARKIARLRNQLKKHSYLLMYTMSNTKNLVLTRKGRILNKLKTLESNGNQ